METNNIVIIGGVAGGATAIARLRRLDEKANIILIEKGSYVSFANCGLPYYIGEVIKDREALFVADAKSIQRKYNVDIRVDSEAVKIDREKKEVEVKNLKTGESYSLPYNKLLMSTGSSPIKPPAEGFDGSNVFTLWNIPDTDKIYEYIKNHNVKKAVVIGAGFIGLEMAENLAHRGISVNVIEKAAQVMAPLDPDMAYMVEKHLLEKGINIITENGVEKILHTPENSKVVLEDKKEIEAELIILSIGIRPNTALAKDAGLELNQRGGVKVNSYMQSSDPDIYAVGDIVEIDNIVLGEKTMLPLAGPANKQARVAADNIISSGSREFRGVQGTSIAKICDYTVAATGLNEKQLNQAGKEYGRDYKISLVHPNSHAGYYPDAMSMTIKLIFAIDGKVLGAQIVGFDGVDKRIDVIATAIRLGAGVEDLAELELAYAPPYSSAKDPVNMAGFVAMNQLEGLAEGIRVSDLVHLGDDDVILDVREELETSAGSIADSIFIPLGKIREQLDKLDKSKNYITVCAVGLRGYIASRILREHGYKARFLMGGFRTYKMLQKGTKCQSQEIKFKDSGEAISTSSTKEENPDPTKHLSQSTKEIKLDVSGLCCPGPIVEVSKGLEDIKEGDILSITSTDPGFYADIVSFVENTGHELIDRSCKSGKFYASIRKRAAVSSSELQNYTCDTTRKDKSLIVFSGDLDKAIASFIIANGAVAMGDKVSMFFTFWGLNILRKNEKVAVKKDLLSKMFGFMMPRGSKKLGLSKMNMMGMGAQMIRKVMKDKNIYSLEDLIKTAQQSGIRIIACQMSMDVMGITKEELIDGVEIGGVATMLAANDKSNMNLFV